MTAPVSKMSSVEVREQLVRTFRRDLIGPGPSADDADIAAERLDAESAPSRWYLTGFLAPADDQMTVDGSARVSNREDAAAQEEIDLGADDVDPVEAGGPATDREEPDAPNTPRRFLPSSLGLTVQLPPEVTEIEVVVTWGDYRTEPPLPPSILLGIDEDEVPPEDDPEREFRKPRDRVADDEETADQEADDAAVVKARTKVEWVRAAKRRTIRLPVKDGRSDPAITIPESAGEQIRGGGLQLETHARLFSYETADGVVEQVRVLTVFLVNRRTPATRFYADVSFIFQARLELVCEQGFRPRRDRSGLKAADPDLRLADLHYRDVCEYAVGRNTSAGWDGDDSDAEAVTRVWTEFLPRAEVERVAPNEGAEIKAKVEFGMDALATAAETDGSAVRAALDGLPDLYDLWIARQRRDELGPLKGARRRETAEGLLGEMELARDRIRAGITILETNEHARTAFRLMNQAIADAARRRTPDQPKPAWRPFQLAFILLNLTGLVDKTHGDRETADLLFFPTGGGKTEAYLGLAAFIIALRRITGPGILGAGVAVIMRYTLRLLTLDQLGRAAGVVCALELMRDDPKNVDEKGRKFLGDWPIEIGLWVGSDASPNRLGKKGQADKTTAIGMVARFKNDRGKAPAPLKNCPWCDTPFGKKSFACVPNDIAPKNLEIRCANADCDFTGSRALPILTVDEPIYRRLPAFLIATVDKFASLPWEGEPGAFFRHVDRHDENGFYGAAEPGVGRKIDNGWSLDPPDLIIQDELHLIAGPLGTIAGLYEAAIDQLATRMIGEKRVRPKIVASTATVRRASAQIEALFDRKTTRIFPPPGISREDSFFAQTVPSSKDPARLYMGIAAQGRGPKLVFLRSLTTLLAAAQAAYDANLAAGLPNPADPYMTALCYFNALRELGGARRIVEDEVRDRTGRYGDGRRRVTPRDQPFANRRILEPMELTSRESTDRVALAKQRLGTIFGGNDEIVDVALATNMISVGLDITRLGLMLVQGQPKTAAEYIQATSRVGRDHRRPGLVLAVLNLHKPRDRMHFEQFRSFHRTFYRAVEATSVTPWAARALDRALAAIVVAAARHVDPELTPNTAVTAIKDQTATRTAVRDAIVARAPAHAIPGGHAALARQVDAVLDDWIETAAALTSTGGEFAYSRKQSPKRLLHMPLERELKDLEEPHKRFQANRSMRDVEAKVRLKITDRYGKPLFEKEDA